MADSAVPTTGPIKIGDVMNAFGVTGPKKLSKLYRGAGGAVPDVKPNWGVPMAGSGEPLKVAHLKGATNVVVVAPSVSGVALPTTQTGYTYAVEQAKTLTLPGVDESGRALVWTVGSGSTTQGTPAVNGSMLTWYALGSTGNSETRSHSIKLQASFDPAVMTAYGLNATLVTLAITEYYQKSIANLADRTTATLDVSGNGGEPLVVQMETALNGQSLTWTYVDTGSTVYTTKPVVDANTKKVTVYSRGGSTSTVRMRASYPQSVIDTYALGDGTGFKTITLTVPERIAYALFTDVGHSSTYPTWGVAIGWTYLKKSIEISGFPSDQYMRLTKPGYIWIRTSDNNGSTYGDWYTGYSVNSGMSWSALNITFTIPSGKEFFWSIELYLADDRADSSFKRTLYYSDYGNDSYFDSSHAGNTTGVKFKVNYKLV